MSDKSLFKTEEKIRSGQLAKAPGPYTQQGPYGDPVPKGDPFDDSDIGTPNQGYDLQYYCPQTKHAIFFKSPWYDNHKYNTTGCLKFKF